MKTDILTLMLLVLTTGCAIHMPTQREVVPLTFQARLDDNAPPVAKVRCILMHPPRSNSADVWSPATIEVKGNDKALAFDFDFRAQDMCAHDSQVTETSRIWFPITVRRETERISCRSETVFRVFYPSGMTNLTVLYHGTNAVGPKADFAETVELK